MTAPTSPGVVPALLPCPFCGDGMQIRHGTIRHVQPGDCIVGQLAFDASWAYRMNRRANRPSLTEDEWKPIDKAPRDTDILIGAWFEDDSNGYFGGSRWKWVASGRIESERVWIDVNDEFHGQIAELAGFDKPTHFKPLRALADRSEPRQEKEGSNA